MAMAFDAMLARIKDVCKRNGLLILSVLSVIVGCLLGFFLRTRRLSQQEISYFQFPGELLMRMLKMLILPLVVSSDFGTRAVYYSMSAKALRGFDSDVDAVAMQVHTFLSLLLVGACYHVPGQSVRCLECSTGYVNEVSVTICLHFVSFDAPLEILHVTQPFTGSPGQVFCNPERQQQSPDEQAQFHEDFLFKLKLKGCAIVIIQISVSPH